jgi:hypothetical protein
MRKGKPEPVQGEFLIATKLDENNQPVPDVLVEKVIEHYLKDELKLPTKNNQALVLVILCDKGAGHMVQGRFVARWCTQKQMVQQLRKLGNHKVVSMARTAVGSYQKFRMENWEAEKHILFSIVQKRNGDITCSVRYILRPWAEELSRGEGEKP